MVKPFISVIVPVYNVEKYLEKCLDSLLQQTFHNYELILVDDGSPDRCGEICDEFKTKCDKITVLHIPNGGVCNARNRGMEIAKGEFFCFVDSDDWVEEHYLEDFAENIIDEDTIIVQDTNRDNDSYSEKKFFGFDDDVFELKSQFTEMVYKNKLYFPLGYPWNKLYSKKIITENHLKFDPAIKLGDDEKWNLAYMPFVKKIRFVSRANYHYIFNPNSISNQARPFEREILRYQFRARYFDFILKNYDNREANRTILVREAEEFFRICIVDRMYKKEVPKKERLRRLKEIAQMPAEYLQFLESDLRFRNIDYLLLKKGQIRLMDSFKNWRLYLNG
ncbi:glycosyltransferase [Weeksellaceae bacterium A-14]